MTVLPFRSKTAPRPEITPHTAQDSKKEITEVLLSTGIVFLQLDATGDDVIVPLFLKNRDLILKYSYAFGILDFEVTEEGIAASLSFDGDRSYTFIPWQAVYLIGNSLSLHVWPDSANKPSNHLTLN